MSVLLLPVLACTVCDTPAGEQLRASVFNDSFWRTLAGIAAPFPILLLGLAVYHFGLPEFIRRPTAD
jgi:hypothetical protein